MLKIVDVIVFIVIKKCSPMIMRNPSGFKRRSHHHCFKNLE